MRDQGDMSMGEFQEAAKKKVAPVRPAFPTGPDREEAEKAFIAFLERVSDSIFGRRDWRYLSEAEMSRIRGAVSRTDAEEESLVNSLEVKRFPLSFYDAAALLELRRIDEGVSGSSTWYVEYGGYFHPLDGSSGPIHDANEAARITLTRENVVDYLRFFCFSVHSDEGPFYIVDSLDHPVFFLDRMTAQKRETLRRELRSPEILEVSAEGAFTVVADVMHGNALFKATFSVSPTGRLEMLDDEAIADDVPALKLKTNY